MAKTEQLLLGNQVCFPIYATSRTVTKLYQPHLEKLNLTYPQYLVMLVLWEKDKITIGRICDKLILQTNTLTPILNKMVSKKFIKKIKSKTDERAINVQLTRLGLKMKIASETIPDDLAESTNMTREELIQVHTLMWKFLRGHKED
jgi:DNA-binding MarR family transcriptional regulator